MYYDFSDQYILIKSNLILTKPNGKYFTYTKFHWVDFFSLHTYKNRGKRNIPSLGHIILEADFNTPGETKTYGLTTRDLADNRMLYKHKEWEKKQIAFINYIERN